MIVSVYYNQENDVLIASSANEMETIKDNGDVTLLLMDSKVVGFNIFKPQVDFLPGLVDVKKLPSEILNLFDEELVNPFVVGQIIGLEKHPKSEKLNICQVELGDNQTQIVCGASNVSLGIKVVVAKVGAVMPSGLVIRPSKLIDVESNGMICSLRELGREQTSPGIVILDEEYQVGQDYI